MQLRYRQKLWFFTNIWLHRVLPTVWSPSVITQLCQTAENWWHSSLVSDVICCLWETDNEVFMTKSLSIMPKTTEQHRVVCSGKSEAAITNNERLCSLLKLIDIQKSPRGLSATAELLVVCCCLTF